LSWTKANINARLADAQVLAENLVQTSEEM
jgi:hypothetical protein